MLKYFTEFWPSDDMEPCGKNIYAMEFIFLPFHYKRIIMLLTGKTAFAKN
jgi:hypothetical protein